MKFKELPEGCYIIHAVRWTVYIERLEDPAKAHMCPYPTIEVMRDGRQYRKDGELLDDMEVEFKTEDDMQIERKAWGARICHITRALTIKNHSQVNH